MKKNKVMKNLIKTELIDKYLQDNNISKTKFCKMCKISPSTLKRIYDNKNVSLIAIFKIARVINIHIHQMFNKK